LVVTVDGFEGPLDLLLALARNQKVDIAKISVLKLADQYLEFIEPRAAQSGARGRLSRDGGMARLSQIAADPAAAAATEGEPTADEMATRLRWRLQRLQAMREAAARLMARDRLGREVFRAARRSR
jgi:segregation and condensation protein A